MPSLPDDSIEEFRQLFKEKYNKEYTLEEAREEAENFIGLFGLLHEIDMREGVADFAKRKKAERSKIDK